MTCDKLAAEIYIMGRWFYDAQKVNDSIEELKEMLYKTDYHSLIAFCNVYGCNSPHELHELIKDLQNKCRA